MKFILNNSLLILLGLLAILVFTNCHKKDIKPEEPNITQPNNPIVPACTNWLGTWYCYQSDSTITDSLVIQIKEYIPNVYATSNYIAGPEGQTKLILYKSNMSIFDPYLSHYCPIELSKQDDTIHFLINSKNYYFRYYH